MLYNKIWEGDQIPQKWRTATIKPLLKDGKVPSLPSSYRPISLTACLGKILEKTIANKLSHFLETNNLINRNLAGFRNESFTTDQVLKLVQMETGKLQGQKKDGRITTDKINCIGADIEIYTDGSTSGQQQNGGTGVHVTSREGNTIYEDKRAAGKY